MYLNKKPILETELVLIYIDDEPAFYARVEKITADVKPKWWRVKLLILTFPAKLTTWIIDDEQIRGADFTMGGTPLRIEKVSVPETGQLSEQDTGESPQEKKRTPARVVSMPIKNPVKKTTK
ncbi:MAG: hypothetical protein ACE5HS_12830 [bacterium]